MSAAQSQQALYERFKTRALELTHGANARVQPLQGDASSRRYYRVTCPDGSPSSLVVMELGDRPMASEEASGEEQPTELPFVNILRYLARGHIRVPAL